MPIDPTKDKLLAKAASNVVEHDRQHKQHVKTAITKVEKLVKHASANAVAKDEADKAYWKKAAADTAQLVEKHSGFIVDVDEDADDYVWIQVSDTWKKVCRVLPSNNFLAWPTYRTKCLLASQDAGGLKIHTVASPQELKKQLDDVTDEEVAAGMFVVQLWKGWCQQLDGRYRGLDPHFPGGVGAEVCIYQRAGFGPTRLMYPLGPGLYPYVKEPYPFRLRFELLYNNEVFCKTEWTRSYWCTRWMAHDSYKLYKQDHETPPHPGGFTQRYWINDRSWDWT